MLKDMERRLEITEYLKQAIAEERVVVLWQPQVDTENLTVYGYEALCRLEGNKYFPNDFIPVAEMSGLVNPLDRVVTKKVIEQLGVWLKEGRKDVGVASINFSAAQLRDKGYCDFLAEQLAKNNVPASLIKIEITESMILGNEEEADKLFARLRSMGITLALDDFGTGYSSLYRMANRPVDFVKLDKSLVDTFMVPGKEGFIDDVTRLIHGLGKTIVVEGVETYEQYQMCLSFGCDIIQGYFFARPMPAEEAISLDPNTIIAEARAKYGDKTRNGNWSKYDRDEHGRWKKKPKE
jgi:EAL domain-containing protein (putative c-di-GMP-specific phosphodiesterase class I)